MTYTQGVCLLPGMLLRLCVLSDDDSVKVGLMDMVALMSLVPVGEGA